MFHISYKLRRILRKIYHFIGFMSLFILFIPFVKADTLPSCYDDFLIPYTTSGGCYYYRANQQDWYSTGNCSGSTTSLTTLIPVDPTTTNYIRFPSLASGDNIRLAQYVIYDSSYSTLNFNNWSPDGHVTYTFDNTNGVFSFTLDNQNASYISLNFSQFLYVSCQYCRPLPWGDQSSGDMAVSTQDLSVCPTPPTPPTPPADETYSSFLDVFLDRFEFLAINFTSNPYLFTFIGIILAWIILELFLRILHIRGGYKK